ncbi:nitrate- and nitrite sensing domain-containing protein [Desulfovibrio sp.]|uniref:methyl-accepting chemotaxis protein n=1 Tax=Desulfovibrio sp. TaxID=885 RepID=UPI0025BF5F25|nr:nitrate- and nitrite sensing domain-containing protein [Desulfovibrio sp.]
MLKNISVRAKLFVLLILPVAALIALAAGNALEKYQTMRAMDMAVSVVDLSSAGSALIHELQKERGLSAGFVARRGAYAEELPGQRKQTEAARQAMVEKTAVFSAANPTASVNAQFAPLAEKLEALKDLRSRIDNYNIAPSEAIAVYSDLIAHMEDILRGVLDQCLDAGLYARAVNFLNLISAKEFAGQERATLNVALSSRRFNKLLYRNWIEHVALQRAYLQDFLERDEALARVYKQKAPPLLEKVETFRREAFESQDEPRLNGDARAWFAASTAYIDALYEVEAAAARDLERTADALSDTARQTLYISLGVTLAVILCTLLLARSLVGNVTRPLRRSVAFAQKVAAGELDAELRMVRKDEFGVLGRALQAMVVSIRETLAKADAAAESARREAERAQTSTTAAEDARALAERRQNGMALAAERIASAVAAMSAATRSISSQIEQSDKGAKEQSARLGEVAAAMEEMSATVHGVAQNSSAAAETAEVAGKQAQQGSASVAEVAENITGVLRHTEELKESMTRLGLRVRDIDKVLNVITDIADQTNLLALNAAIEAARAGEAGRGFAVVADEVRKLAEKTMAATKEVAEVLSGIQRDAAHNIATVDQTVDGMSRTTDLTRQSDEVLREIVALSDKTSEQIRSIAAASEQQAAGSETISRSVEGVNRIAVENMAGMDHSAKAVRELLEQTRLLENLVRDLQDEEHR